jgi:hypothetical protein
VTDSFQIQGRTVTLPVEVRRARTWAAQFLLEASAVEQLMPPGLSVAKVAGRAMAIIPVARYEDGDLDAYNEVGVAFLARAAGRRGIGVYIHHLPVTQGFTLEAGRTIWGFPKFMADIDIVEHPGGARILLSSDNEEILQLDVRRGWVSMPSRAIPTYTYLDGVLRETKWTTSGKARARLGGGRLELGSHPIAKELRALGLPKKAFAVQTVPEMRASFGPSTVIN